MENTKTPKKTNPSGGYRNESITNLRDVMKQVGDRRYRAEFPIFSTTDDRLMLQEGKSVDEERFEKMKRDIWRSTTTNKKSPYYTTKREVHSN
ncbi:MAG: hypothetical protein NTU63_02540 [Candidatus Pacearchaeota archaeon]|nr:hypothetical protein [Candidatus Pacearchaeota archaeon]